MAESIKWQTNSVSGGRIEIRAYVQLPCRHTVDKKMTVADNRATVKAAKATLTRELKERISHHFLNCRS